ncbi:hypothetical protein ZWY2020_054383 [Hordeum vulgare]|uniref:Uncharacterized protein n=1 Tax=Hordeum vulgare subsp. vulgare TaxID=112509 RepID=A0A8I6WZ55_HORVV|nr:hypothetical protein ZWY2020_054383 [Hordeum vulgare]
MRHVLFIVFLLVGYLAAASECRLEVGSRHSGGHTSTSITAPVSANSMALVDESKIVVKFCTQVFCDIKDLHKGVCYCCEKPGRPCYQTRSECLDNCPLCNPECSPPLL